MWRLALPGRGVEEISLGPTLLDEKSVAYADAVRGPGGGGEIRLVLTADGARTLRDATSQNVGSRLGIVVNGRLRAAPVVLAPVTDGILVVGGLAPEETEALARGLAPPSPTPTPVPASSPGASARAVLRLLDGTWDLRSATMNGQAVPDRNVASGTWTFSGGILTLTNGVGETGQFTLSTDPAAPDAFRLDPVPPSKERAGWMLFKREGDRLRLTFFDGFNGRPEDFAPAPKKVVLEFSLRGSR